MDGDGFKEAELDALEHVVRDASAKPIELSLPLLKHITNDFSEESVIGRGGFAVVYLGMLPSGSRIAVKRIINSYMYEKEFLNEVAVTMMVAHKNIVRSIGYCADTHGQAMEYNGKSILAEVSERLICMEYVPNGTLGRHIGEYGELDWNQRYQILKGICQGLHHLHDEMHVFHGDIKPDNILIGDNLMPKIYDFGLSMSFDEGQTPYVTEKIAGTIGYMAPELYDRNTVSFEADIYSFGVVITELLTGKKQREPSVEQALKKLRKRLVQAGAFSSWEDKYHQVRTCLEIGHTCMENYPDKRPTALEIIQRLDETESVKYSALPLWQSGDEESDLSDTESLDTDTTTEFFPSEEEPASADTTGETSTQVIELPASVDLSDLTVLEKITDDFSHERIVGKDGTFIKGSHKAFVYKGDMPRQETIAVKRLIGVAIPVEKFKKEAQQFMSLAHKNIVKVAGYCHDQSRGHKLVRFKGAPAQAINGPEQLLSYEYVHNGSLRDYLIGQGSREIDWKMRYKLIKGTCAGLHYLHKGCVNCPIVHLNLSPSNVLLDENYIPHITGFDFSKLIGEKNTKSVVLKLDGPIAYLPPDFFHSKGTDLKYLATVDIYSLGLIILEIATQQEIKGKHGVLINSVRENWREDLQITQLYSSLEAGELQQVKMCIDIGLHCVQTMPEKRPTAGAIMLWLDKGSKPVPVPKAGAGVSRPPVPVPRAGPRGVPRPPVPTNIAHADDSIQAGKVKPAGFMKRFFR